MTVWYEKISLMDAEPCALALRGKGLEGTSGAVASPSTNDDVRPRGCCLRLLEKARVRRWPTNSPQSVRSRLVASVSYKRCRVSWVVQVVSPSGFMPTLRKNVALQAEMRKKTVARRLGRA